VDIQLHILNRRLEERKIFLVPTEAGRDWLARTGYDPVYGARPLKRLIQRDIENPLALKILQGEFIDGDRIVVDANDDGLTFKKEPALLVV
jgi:ATP-dependent Clp protease ATP-binding subunit ClpB